MSQDPPYRMTLLAAARAINNSKLADLRLQIEAVPGRGPAPVRTETFSAYLAHTALAPLRIATTITGAFATIGLLLGMLGLLGALSDAARQRRRELVIRIALGAQQRRILYYVLKEGGRLACAGTVLGMLGSLALSRLLTRFTLINGWPAWWVWLAAPLALAVVVLFASVLPVRRTLMINPLEIMREDN
jgi:ABC-type antimicrobial peptide transport system permease subunit